MNLLHIGLAFVLGLFIGSNLGVGLICLLQANRASTDDALWHLGQLYRKVTDPRDAWFVPPGGVIDNVQWFLERHGED